MFKSYMIKKLKKIFFKLMLNNINMSFIEQKTNFIEILIKVNSKLLFPQSVITSLKNSGLDTFSYYLSSYNSYIKKSRKLELDLKNLEKWGLILNSYTMWNISISYITNGIITYTNEIINYIANADTINKMLLNQASIKMSNIQVFLNLNKINNEYILNVPPPKESIAVSKDKIPLLLPRCLISTGTSLTFEEQHKLDESDIILVVN